MVLTRAQHWQEVSRMVCSANETCVAGDFFWATQWIKYFVEKNATVDISKMSLEEFVRLSGKSKQMYNSVIGTNDPDLSAFKARGEKIVGYHGLVSPAFRLLLSAY